MPIQSDGNVQRDPQGASGQSFPPSADLAMGGHKLTGLADPTNPQDAATRAYVLANAGGANVPIRLALMTFAGAVAWTQNVGAWTAYTTADSQTGGVLNNAGGTPGGSDKVSRTFSVAATGTYHAYIEAQHGNNTGTWQVSLDSAAVGDIQDSYAASGSYGHWHVIPLGTLTAGTIYTLSLAVVGHNDSGVSPYYYLSIQDVIIQ